MFWRFILSNDILVSVKKKKKRKKKLCKLRDMGTSVIKLRKQRVRWARCALFFHSLQLAGESSQHALRKAQIY